MDEPDNLSPDAAAAMDAAADDEEQRIFVSAISLVELRYLSEKGKIKPAVLPRILAEIDAPQPIISVIPLDRQVADNLAAIARTAVPDMPDRIIAATALTLSLPLITRDTKIRALTSIVTVW